MFGVGMQEILPILLLVLILFGAIDFAAAMWTLMALRSEAEIQSEG